MSIEEVRAKLSADQTNISNSASFTLVELDVAVVDDGSDFNTTNHRWSPQAGKVDMYGQVFFNSLNATGTNYEVRILKNGTDILGTNKIKAGGASVGVYANDTANGTDYYELYARGNGSSGALTLPDNGDQTYFTGKAYGGL